MATPLWAGQTCTALGSPTMRGNQIATTVATARNQRFLRIDIKMPPRLEQFQCSARTGAVGRVQASASCRTGDPATNMVSSEFTG